MSGRKHAGHKSEELAANSQWVMITQECNLKTQRDEDCRPLLCRLRHPKTGEAAFYMFTDGCRRVHEVMTFDEGGHRSWFIDNYVQSDGSLLVTSPIDPVFLILPYLVKASKSGKFMPLDSLLDDVDFADCHRLNTCCNTDELIAVAETKGVGSSAAVRYNHDKAMSWLKQKVDGLIVSLQQHGVDVNDSVSSLTFVKTKKNSSCSEDDYVKYAAGMIADYLQPEMAQQLKDYLGIKPDVVHYADDGLPVSKKAKVDSLSPLEDYSNFGVAGNSRKTEKLTAAQKKLSKVDKNGMKAMSSFFMPKASAK